MATVTIIGGHGKVALLLAPLLLDQGHQVSSVIRNPDHSADVSSTGAEPVVVDVEHMSTGELAELLAGSDAVVWSAGAGGGNPARTYAVDRDAAIRSMDAARQAGVARYVMVSYFGAGPDHGVPQTDSFFPYADAKSSADAHLVGTDLDWTILRPSHLTLDPATGRIETGPGVTPAQVSRANVAAVVAAALAQPASVGRIVEFNDGDYDIAEVLA